MSQTPEEYFLDEESWGNYQFIKLSDIINDLMLETTDPDSYLVNVPKHKLLNNAKKGIRTLNREVRKTVHAIEFTLGAGRYFVLPQDYLDWVRVSVVGPDGKLLTLDVNDSISTAEGYLQDNDAEILFDADGEILLADSNNSYGRPYKKYEFHDSVRAGYQTLDTSKFSRNGEFKVHEQRGTITFSADLEDREIVLEYLSDGLELDNLRGEDILVHKDLSEVLFEYTYAFSIATRRNVPRNEKDRAKRSYKTMLHKVKVDAASFDMNQVSRVMRTSTKQF